MIFQKRRRPVRRMVEAQRSANEVNLLAATQELRHAAAKLNELLQAAEADTTEQGKVDSQ